MIVDNCLKRWTSGCLCMKDSNVTFDKGFWKSFGWFLIIAILICCLPWLFTREIGFDFTQTG